MKRYLAFAYDGYYPAGAKQDFVGDFDAGDDLPAQEDGKAINDYLDVLDTETGKWREYRRLETRVERIEIVCGPWVEMSEEEGHG